MVLGFNADTLSQFKAEVTTDLWCDTCCGVKASEAKLRLLYKHISEKNLTSPCLAKLFPNLPSHRVDWQTSTENFVGIIHRLNLVSLHRPTWILIGALDLLLRTVLATCLTFQSSAVCIIDSICGCRKILRINIITLCSPWRNVLIFIIIMQIHFCLLTKPRIRQLVNHRPFTASSGLGPRSTMWDLLSKKLCWEQGFLGVLQYTAVHQFSTTFCLNTGLLRRTSRWNLGTLKVTFLPV
jgi:hypothetical protein